MAWFSCATHRPIATNTGGRLSPNLGLVLHHAVADGSLWSFFNSPSAQVSAHFWVAQSGLVEQYVDTDVVAWHGMDLNSRYVGVETEGCSNPPHADPMSEAMVAGLAAIFAEGMARHGWPAVCADANGQPGFGFHRMAVSTACPCDVRLSRRDDILAMATGGTAPPAPTQEDVTMKVIKRPDGRQYITDGVTKRYIGEPTMEAPDLLKICGQTDPVELADYTIDRMPEILPVVEPDSVQVDLENIDRGAQ
jgi:hypothetical protein